MGCLIEMFVVVDAEWNKPCSGHHGDSSGAPDLWGEKARCHAGEDHECRKAMDVWYAHAACISRNFGVVPFDGEGDRRVAEHAEIVAVVGVFRNPLAGKDYVLSESLLNPGVEFVAEAGTVSGWAQVQSREAADLRQDWRIRCWRVSDFR